MAACPLLPKVGKVGSLPKSILLAGMSWANAAFERRPGRAATASTNTSVLFMVRRFCKDRAVARRETRGRILAGLQRPSKAVGTPHCLRGPGNPNTTNNPRPALVNLVVVTIWKCRHVLLSVECLLCYSYTQSRRQLQITNRNPGRALLFRTRRLFLAAWWRVRISAPKIFCPPRFRNRLCASGFHGSWGQDSCSGESDFSGTTSLFWTTTRNPRKSNPKNRVRERDHQCSRHTGYPNQRGPTLGDLVKWASHTYIISTESDIENRSLNRIIRELIATPCKTEKQAFLTKIPQ